jgi:uncharacterized membrane protein
MLVVPRDRVRETEISIEEAVKFIISAGSVTPDGLGGQGVRRGLDLEGLFGERGA